MRPDEGGFPDVSPDPVYVKVVDDPEVVMYTDSPPADVPR
jgi:hypothetical protein